MTRYFFGKFNDKYPEQIENKYYAAGPEGSSWYGNVQPGDYVFPVSEQRVLGLWRVKAYTEIPNSVHLEDNWVVAFEEEAIATFNPPVPVASFIKSPYFDLSINLFNKITKATNGVGFFEINTTSLLVDPRHMHFDRERNLFVILEDIKHNHTVENALYIVIENYASGKIVGFEEFKGGTFVPYTPLQDLYNTKNIPDERYSLHELLKYANQEAMNKARYLTAVLGELKQKGVFQVSNPIQLYDNILVGRRRTPIDSPKGIKNSTPQEPEDAPEETSKYRDFAELLHFNPNLILYGPPGTGKTYATKKIIESFEELQNNSQVPFKQVEAEERVRFITFHQSYSYEEFVEGIRPEIEGTNSGNTDEKEYAGDIAYRVHEGILRQIVRAANAQELKAETSNATASNLIHQQSQIWKVSLGQRSDEHTYNMCKKENRIAVDWLENLNLQGKEWDEIFTLLEQNRAPDAKKPKQDANSLDAFINQMDIGDIVFIYDGPQTIRDIGVIQSGYQYLEHKNFPHSRSVVWLKEYDEPVNVFRMNGGIRLTLKTIYPLERMDLSDVLRLIREDEKPNTISNLVEAQSKPYYLIIDEINRGNISKIFGELMTLLEKDKRETLEVTLPYSNKKFTLPRNLYIIGTMNTSDRSIAILDNALRRRFVFVEIEPDYTVFDELNANVVSNIESIPLANLLQTLNERITKTLDRDHRIGQAYLMDLFTIDDLYKAWYYKILPLIGEYFYQDVKAMRNVVGKAFFDDSGSIVFLERKGINGNSSPFEQAILNLCAGKIE